MTKHRAIPPGVTIRTHKDGTVVYLARVLPVTIGRSRTHRSLEARARLVKAREAQAEALNEFEQAVVRGVQVLDGPTEVQKLLGFTSRSSVTAIVSRVNARPAE